MASVAERKLEETPTWAVAVVCVVIIGISVLLELFLHKAGHFCSKKKKASMVEVLEKIKAELMILGFISLLLTVGQDYIAKICIPEKVADTMWPCPRKSNVTLKNFGSTRRLLAAPAGKDPPCSAGKVSFVSAYGIHQLHIFIFYLAVFHVFSSAITMGLGRLKIRGWRNWEEETESMDYKFLTDPSRFNVVQENAFVQQHVSCWNSNGVLVYIASFFRQFFRSVRKSDYWIIRHGFISTHLAPGTKFNFQKYIQRSLIDDFKQVVGISLPLWGSGILLLLLNVEGWHAMFWISLLPLIILLVVGTKLQAIITKLAIEIHNKHVVVQGMPEVSPSDRHFWFGYPKFVLFLIHFTFFQNAFQLTYFLWIWNKFGLDSCYHKNGPLLIARICLGVFVQILCSYVTLPLYALVSQLGSHMKRTIFDEHIAQSLQKWHQHAKEKQGKGVENPTRIQSASPDASPSHPFHRHKSVPQSNPAIVGAGRGGNRERHILSSREIERPSQDELIARSLDNDIELGSRMQSRQ